MFNKQINGYKSTRKKQNKQRETNVNLLTATTKEETNKFSYLESQLLRKFYLQQTTANINVQLLDQQENLK